MKNGWSSQTLGEVCQIKPPKSEARARLAASGLVSFLPMEDLGIDEKFVRATQAKPLSAVVGSYTYFADGDVLLAKITPCFENGKLGIAEGLTNGIGFGSSEYIVFRPNKMLSKEWLYYYLSREAFRIEGAARMSGAVGHKRVSKEFIETYRIPIPPLPEQQRIVAILDEAFDSIAAAKVNAERNLQNARALFEGHLQFIFAQHNKGWMEEPLGSVCDVRHGYAFDGADFSSDVPEGRPLVITPGNFTEVGELSFNHRNTKRFSGKAPAGFQFDVGDLVIVMTDLSSKMKILGKPAFVETEGVLHNQRIGRVVFLNDRIEKRFVYYFMMSEGFLRNIKGSATGTMVKHTAPKRILSNVIPFPSDRNEQRAIICRLDDLREKTLRLEFLYQQKLVMLDALKRSLLHQAFSGELTKDTVQSKVVPFPKTIPGLTPIDMHAGILAIAYQNHENRSRQSTFGHVKAEKIAHMVESYVGIDLGRTPVKDAAGPNDYRHLKKVEHRAEKAGYFSFKQSTVESYTFRKLRLFDQLAQRARTVLGSTNAAVDELIELMVPMQTQQAEIFATVFAAWNNLLIDGKTVSDEAIVSEARENWHKDKLKIPRDRFFKAIDWMKEKNIVPVGRGKKVLNRNSV